MIIGISDSSDSDEIKHSEDNTNNASHMITTKRTKKKAPDTKKERKILKTFETSTQLAVYKPRPSSKQSAITENKLLTKRSNRNSKKNIQRVTATPDKQLSEPPPVHQIERLQITEKSKIGKIIRMFEVEELNNIEEDDKTKVKVLSSEILVAFPINQEAKSLKLTSD